MINQTSKTYSPMQFCDNVIDVLYIIKRGHWQHPEMRVEIFLGDSFQRKDQISRSLQNIARGMLLLSPGKCEFSKQFRYKNTKPLSCFYILFNFRQKSLLFHIPSVEKCIPSCRHNTYLTGELGLILLKKPPLGVSSLKFWKGF